jgi:hypothetical protein
VSKPQATKASPEQLDYLAYWQKRGFTFGPDDVIPKSKWIKPRAWRISPRVELAVSAALIALIFVALYFKGAL